MLSLSGTSQSTISCGSRSAEMFKYSSAIRKASSLFWKMSSFFSSSKCLWSRMKAMINERKGFQLNFSAVCHKSSPAIQMPRCLIWDPYKATSVLTLSLALPSSLNICLPRRKRPIRHAKMLSCCQFWHFCSLQPFGDTTIPELLYLDVHPSEDIKKIFWV